VGPNKIREGSALKGVEPPTFPGAKLAIVQGDPGKEGPFASRRLSALAA
jgi:hypothetical protein